MTAIVCTIHDEVWHCPVTLQVVADWERYTGRNMADMASPTATDFGYLCYRAAFYAGHIPKKMRLQQFMQLVNGWDITHIDIPISVQVEEWLRDQPEN
jgi:hypothetical protein